MTIVIPTLPPLPAYPASGTDVERGQWLTLAGLHMKVAHINSDQARMDQFTASMDKFCAEFAKVMPPMGAMNFDQVVELIKLVKGG